MTRFRVLFDPVVYDPPLLALMQTAFDEAWQMHDAGYEEGSEARDVAREALAKAIMNLAERGERDPTVMRVYGLEALMRLRNPYPEKQGAGLAPGPFTAEG